MKKRYMVVALNDDLPPENNMEVLHLEAYGIKSAIKIATEMITARYTIEPYKWEIVNVFKTI